MSAPAGNELGVEVPDGDPGALHDGGAALTRAGRLLGEVAGGLHRSMLPGLGWGGTAALMAGAICGEEREIATSSEEAMGAAAGVVHALARDLAAAQKACRHQLALAREARQRADRARQAAVQAAARAAAARIAEVAATGAAALAEASGLPAAEHRADATSHASAAGAAEREAIHGLAAAEDADGDLEHARKVAHQHAHAYKLAAQRAATTLRGLAAQAPLVPVVNGHPVEVNRTYGHLPELALLPKPRPVHGPGAGDLIHLALDGIGLFPGLGEPFDLLNSGIYAAEGDAANAGASLAAVVPGFGDGVTLGKWGVKGAKAAEGAADASKIVKGVEAAADGRRTWRESESVVEDLLGDGFERQLSFKDGEIVPWGTKGSSRPDLYDAETKTSAEVKNYLLDTARRRASLVRNVAQAAKTRAENLPVGTTQHLTLDISGQDISDEARDALAKRIAKRTGGIIKEDNIDFIG